MVEISEAVHALDASLASCSAFATLSDGDLIAAQRPVAELRKRADALSAALAGEIARRSTRELGHSGLAQRSGFANAETLLQAGSGLTKTDTTKLVHVGVILAAEPEAQSASGSEPPELDEANWRAIIARSVQQGALSVDSAESILRGLAGVDDRVAALDISAAARSLIAASRQTGSTSPDALFRLARQRRDELDQAGVASREAARRERRSFFIRVQPDGMYRGSFLLDPEDGQLVSSAIDAALSPRRGGPRFVGPQAKAAAEALIADPRTNDQLAADAFVDLVRLAIDADPQKLLGSRRPAVRVVVHESDLRSHATDNHTGRGYLVGNHDPIAIETVERYICNTGIIGVKFDGNNEAIDIGREQRLYAQRQRVGLEVRDGGCRFPECDRPPSYCEAHHINDVETRSRQNRPRRRDKLQIQPLDSTIAKHDIVATRTRRTRGANSPALHEFSCGDWKSQR